MLTIYIILSVQIMSIYNTTIKPKNELKPYKTISSYNNFLKQLVVGQGYETVAQQKIKALHSDVKEIISNDTNSYDFITLPSEITYEVKFDSLCLRTGFFFIEIFGYGKKSGLSVTKAQFYIICDGKYYFLIETIKLKQLVQKCNVKKTKDGSTIGFMLNRFKLIKNSLVI